MRRDSTVTADLMGATRAIAQGMQSMTALRRRVAKGANVSAICRMSCDQSERASQVYDIARHAVLSIIMGLAACARNCARSCWHHAVMSACTACVDFSRNKQHWVMMRGRYLRWRLQEQCKDDPALLNLWVLTNCNHAASHQSHSVYVATDW